MSIPSDGFQVNLDNIMSDFNFSAVNIGISKRKKSEVKNNSKKVTPF